MTTKRQNVQDFYRGKKIFLTGSTGFLGMVTIEKLLHHLDVDTIYMLVREKKGKSIQARVNEMADNTYYEALKKKYPEFKKKLVPLSGDCVLVGLGLSVEDVHTLLDNVEIVLHCAATVKFDERLDAAYAVNVTGTKEVISLCHRMKHLQAFVHVSTVYSNCHQQYIEERFYDCTIGPNEIGALLTKLGPEAIEAHTKEIIGKWPNTYTFTKALAEDLIRQECQTLPVAVFRPAIIVSTYQGHTPGWTNNYYGPVGGTVAVYTGILRVLYMDQDDCCNIVPVDKVADGIIAAGWEVATRVTNSESDDVCNGIRIYNYVSSMTNNNIDWPEYLNMMLFYGQMYPLLKGTRTPDITITSNMVMYNWLIILYHYIPAFFADVCFLLSGNKPKFLKLYLNCHKQMACTHFFLRHKWYISNSNVHALYDTLSLDDRHLLSINILDVNWKSFMKNYMLGIRKYLIKEDASTIEPARRNVHIFGWMKTLLKYMLFLLIMKYAYSAYSCSGMHC